MSDPPERLAFAYNPTSREAVGLRDRALAWCRSRAIAASAEAAAEREALARTLSGSRALVVLGGDGTFLRAVQAAVGHPDDVPMVGVNVGKVGFLSQVEAPELEGLLERVVAGGYGLESRLAIEATVRRADGSTVEPLVALNEAAVVRGARPTVVRLDVAIGGSHLATYVADGLLVASPTGSTGYSFSAGGPILEPVSRNLVVTAVAAYLAAIRSVVVSSSQTVAVRVLAAQGVQLSIDGHIDVPLAVGDSVEVQAHERPFHFLVPEGAVPFWDLVRRKAELLPS